jgi:hypothetical protein
VSGRDPGLGRFVEGRQSKKLVDAAEFWARGGKHGGPGVEDDLALFGVHPEAVKAWLGDEPEGPEDFDVWPDNWPTLQLFLTLQTQWRLLVGGAGGASFIGLDYSAVQAAMLMLGIPRKERAEMFVGLCMMERAALPVLNSRNSEEKK